MFKETYQHWRSIEPAREGAVVSFYALSSLVPLSIILGALITLILGDQEIFSTVFSQLGNSIGGESISFIKNAVGQSFADGALPSIVLGTIILITSSIGMFNALKHSIDRIWETSTVWKKRPFFIALGMSLKQKLVLFSVIPLIALVFISSFVLTILVHTVSTSGVALFPAIFPLIQILDPILSFIVSVTLFFLLYKILPERKLPFGELILGSLLTAVLFLLGEFLIGLYLEHVAGLSVFGAAGSLVALLLFVFYSSQIVFIGASCTYVYAKKYGSLSQIDHK